MNGVFVIVAVVVVALFIVTELAVAVLPMIIVITLVPPWERRDLADLLAAADSSPRLRLWPAIRLAVAARRLGRGSSVPACRRARGPVPPPGSPGETHRHRGKPGVDLFAD
jgi:hypothetical protein